MRNLSKCVSPTPFQLPKSRLIRHSSSKRSKRFPQSFVTIQSVATVYLFIYFRESILIMHKQQIHFRLISVSLFAAIGVIAILNFRRLGKQCCQMTTLNNGGLSLSYKI